MGLPNFNFLKTERAWIPRMLSRPSSFGGSLVQSLRLVILEEERLR